MSDGTGVPHTCPLIDEAIDLMEQTRSANSQLRERAVESMEQVENLEQRVEELESENEGLEARVAELQQEADQRDNRVYELEQTLATAEVA